MPPSPPPPLPSNATSSSLPIHKYKDEIIRTIQSNLVTVIIGETGSGKTTQLSQMLYESNLFSQQGMIGVTQPRRVAAVSAARRVAEEQQCQLGRMVGYKVRFEDWTDQTTKIKYLTDGALLRETLDDPTLAQYSVLVLDEAHERSLHTDVLLALTKMIVKKRSLTPHPLRLVITSATLDSERFSAHFDHCPVLRVEGRTFPVEIFHVDTTPSSYFDATLELIIDIHCNQPPGDMLVFLTGQQEIDRAVDKILSRIASLPPGSCAPLAVLPVYAALPPELQARVFAPAPPKTRRCIVATNIAETSVTVDGVVYVIDPGMVKQKSYNPRTAMDALDVSLISRVQATQRAGRAGRTRPGQCFRLYTKQVYEQDMKEATRPEMQRTTLVSVVLFLKSLVLDFDVLKMDFLDPPDALQVDDAVRQLVLLDALDKEGAITEIGKQMAALPIDPALARALLAAKDLHCLEEMMTVAAMLSAENVFLGSKGPDLHGEAGHASSSGKAILSDLVAEGLGDHILLLRLYEVWARASFDRNVARELGLDLRGLKFARDVRNQLVHMMKMRNDKVDDEEERTAKKAKYTQNTDALRHALTIGFATRLACRMPRHNGYRVMVHGSSSLVQIHPSSEAGLKMDEEGLLPKWIIYHELVQTTRPYLRGICTSQESWTEPLLAKIKPPEPTSQPHQPTTTTQPQPLPVPKRDDQSIQDAKARYLARKAAQKL